MTRDQTVSLVWELSVSAGADRPLNCTCSVNYQPLNDDAVADVYEVKHSFMLTSCKARFDCVPRFLH